MKFKSDIEVQAGLKDSSGNAGTSGQVLSTAGTSVSWVDASTLPAQSAQNLITEVWNETGATLTKGTIVYINSGHGNLPTITKALATSDATSAQTYGVVRADITNNNNGWVVAVGRLLDLDTQIYAPGTQLYLSSTTAGTWTSTKQYAPAHLVYIGIVVRSHPTQGVVEIKIQNGYELDELHNVSAQTPANNNGIFYNTSTNLWEAKSISNALGYTPANDAAVVHLSGAETITGIKTFSSALILNSSLNITSGAYSIIFNPSNSAYWQTYVDSSNVFNFGFNGNYAKASISNLGNFTANSFIKIDGTSLQYLMADGSVSTGPVLTGYVPYTGATGPVDLGAYDLTVHSITVGTGASSDLSNTAVGLNVLSNNTPVFDFGARNIVDTCGNHNDGFYGVNAYRIGDSLAISVYVNIDGGGVIGIEPPGSGTIDLSGTYAISSSEIGGSCNVTFDVFVTYENPAGSNNTALGQFALQVVTYGNNNTAVGAHSLMNNGSGNNTAIGAFSLEANLSGSSNTAMGYSSLFSNTGGYNNTAVGADTLSYNTTGYHNIAIGKSSLFSNTTGITNVAFGVSSLSNNTTGYANVGIGSDASYYNTTGFSNVGIGDSTSFYNTTGIFNTAIGQKSLWANTTGSKNVVIGQGAAENISVLNNSIIIGQGANPNSTNQTNQIVIGYLATGLGTNTTVIGNNSTLITAIRGTLLSGTTSGSNSAQVQIDSTTKGFLPPRMTNAQRLAITSPAIGLMVYCTNAVEGLYVYKSTGWTFVI